MGIGIREVDGLQVTVVLDNIYDALIDDPPCGKRFRTEPKRSICAEHGLSFFVTAYSGARKYSFFFDFGSHGDLLLHNLNVLGIEPQRASCLILSHGHFDHWGGLSGLKSFLERKGVRGLPFYVGRGLFARRFAKRPEKEELLDLGELKAEDLEGTTRIYEVEEPFEFLPGCYISGRIEMLNEYERLPENLFALREGEIRGDDFMEEICVFFKVRGKGLVVLSGCAHRGIVNSVNQVLRLTGERRIFAIIGGFHLVHSDDSRIKRTIADLSSFSPEYVIPCHCTGILARMLFLENLKGKSVINTSGTTYNFGSL